MLKLARIGLSLAIFFCFPMHYAEARMNKCTDGKQITYTTEPCEKTGLSSAGPIKDAVTVMPAAPKPQKDSSEKSGKEHGENYVSGSKAHMNDDSGADVSRETTIKPVSPLVEKLLGR
jgi:hypothetical protein